MQPFVIHSIPGSPFGRATLIALEEKHAPYRLAPVPAGQFRTPEHLGRHPFGRVPVMEHDGYSLYETQAILRYIDRIVPEPALTPKDARAAGRMDQLMNINDWYLFQGCGNVITFQRIVRPKITGAAADEQAIAGAMPKAHQVFSVLAAALGEQPYFVGTAVTLADVLIAPPMDFFAATPEWEPLTREHPNLRSWLARMNERPSLKATTWEKVAAMGTT
jgi:glutathione S-transferase